MLHALRPLRSARRLAPALLTLAAVGAPTALAQQPSAAPEPLALVRVALPADADTRRAFLAQGFDLVEHGAPDGRWIEVVAGPADLDRLRGLGLELEVLERDLVAFYERRLLATLEDASTETPPYGGWLTPPFAQGSMSGYYTWSEMAGVLDQIAAAYPAIVAPKFSLGSSWEGRELWAIKLSDNPGVDEAEPEVRIDAMHHAREPGAMHTALWTLLGLVEDYGSDPLATWIVDNREVWFVPVVNPDGYVHNQTTNPGGGGMWRKNRRNNGSSFGVDLNRNYPHAWGFDNSGSSPTPSSGTYRGPEALSEPENAAMYAFMQARSFRTAITAHTYSNLWLAPYGYRPEPPPAQAELDEIGALATVINGYPYGIGYILLYPFNGITTDTDYFLFDTFSWLPEIGSSSDGFWPPQSRIVPLAEENRIGFYRTILAAGAWVHVTDTTLTDLGDGDGHLEPGESFALGFDLRNSGRAATTGTIELALTSPSPELVLDVAVQSLPSLGSFSSASADAAPLAFTVASSANLGAVVSFTATVTWEGFVETFTTTVPVGEPAPFLHDDLEIDLGWTAGVPGDTATSGLWAFGDPVPTSSGGQPSNPGDDASPDGVNCFTTGNGATTASGDDVDDGVTTLISPAFDLSSTPSAVLTYERWFANRNTADDVLEIDLSNDDGASWTPLERVSGQQNAWTPVRHLLNETLPLTSAMRLRVRASDDPDNSITEAAFDEVTLEVYDGAPHFTIYGERALGEPLSFQVSGPADEPYWVFGSKAPASLTMPGVTGTVLIDPTQLSKLKVGTLPSSGLDVTTLPAPDDPAFLGRTFYAQGMVATGGALVVTNRDEVTF